MKENFLERVRINLSVNSTIQPFFLGHPVDSEGSISIFT